MKRDSEDAPALLGIDCGGTRSIAIYQYDNVQRRIEAGPGNVGLLNDKQLGGLFRQLSSVHRGLPAPAAIAIGMAGAAIESRQKRIVTAAAQVWRNVPCHAVGDLETALAAAELDSGRDTDFAAIVIVLSGTGSIFYGRNAQGKRVRIGGWGHVVGDKGSAYEIGLRALKAVLYYFDRDGQVPRFGKRLLGTLLLNDLREIPEWALTASKTEIAALAREVSVAAGAGDEMARDILEGAAQSIAEDALTCAARLSKRTERVKFVLTGGVLLNQPSVRRRVALLIRQRRRLSQVAPLKHEPALGALELAGRLLSKHPGASFEIKRHPVQPGPTAALADHWTSNIELGSSPTELRNARSRNLDKLPLRKALALMLSEDEKLPAAIAAESKKIERAIQLIVRSFKSGGRLFYVGAGTSGRLGVLDASECPPTFRTDPDMVQGIIAGGQTALWRAVEGAEDDPNAGANAIESRGITRRDTVVGIAASGRTPFVWGALDEANRRGAATVLLTFNPTLKIPRQHRPTVVIAPNVGPEVLTGSTRLKSGTATKLILNMFTTLAMVRMGKVLSNLMVDVKPTNVKLRDRAVRIVRTLTNTSEARARAVLEKSGWVIKEAVAWLRS